MAVGQAFQDVLEVGERLHAIEFCRGQQRRDGRPARCTTVGTGEEMVLAAKRDRADRSFDRVIVEFDTSVIEETAKGAPTGECISDRLSKAAAAWGASGWQPFKQPREFRPERKFPRQGYLDGRVHSRLHRRERLAFCLPGGHLSARRKTHRPANRNACGSAKLVQVGGGTPHERRRPIVVPSTL
jgi:hypothetical protein